MVVWDAMVSPWTLSQILSPMAARAENVQPHGIDIILRHGGGGWGLLKRWG
jgi:hypothetical protein